MKLLSGVCAIAVLIVNNASIAQPVLPPIASNSIPESTEHKFTVAGEQSYLRDFYALQVTCEPVDWVKVFIVAQPQHGKAALTKRQTPIFYSDPDPRKACNGKMAESTAVTYRPEAGYSGVDSFVVEVINSESFASRTKMEITVVKPPTD